MVQEDALVAYIYFLRHERGLTEGTIRTSLSVQRTWEAWLLNHAYPRNWLNATPDDVRGFLSDNFELADQTVGVIRWHIRSIYGWLKREGHAQDSIALGMTARIRAPKSRRPWFVPTPGQINGLLNIPDRSTINGIQDRLMMELLYATGVRANELLTMQIQKVWPKDRKAAVWGKGSKERLVVMNESAADWLSYYLKIVHPRLLRRRRLAAISTKSDGYLFPSCHVPSHLSYSSLQQRLKQYSTEANLPMLTAHSFRRAFATHLYMGGANLRSIQMLLGHSHVSTTSHYTQAVTNHLREIVERHHPRGVNFKAS
jgi:integrase/recombinase XerD